jgi:alpha-glucosidase
MRRQALFPQFAAPGEAPLAYSPLGKATVVDHEGGTLRLRSGSSVIEVTALAPDVFRVGVFGGGRAVHYASEALADTQWAPCPVRVTATAERVRLETTGLAADIGLDPLRISFLDGGRQIAQDDPDLGMGYFDVSAEIDPLGPPAIVYKQHRDGTRYFGCGERTGGLDKTGTHQMFWNVDPPTGHTASLNNLYTSVPFVLALRDGQAWGMFVDSSYRLEFDLACENPARSGFAVDGGPLIYYVFGGPTPRAVVEQYTRLTGRIPMPPRWALGYHQSRWGYMTADEVLGLARTFRAHDLPLDAIYLDIDYMSGYRVFTWDRDRFPDPAGLVRELEQLGVKLVTIVDPGVKVDAEYSVYTSGRDADVYCKTFFGSEYRNVVWPGTCVFPDFTSSRTREWWASNLPALLDAGVAGIWCDMNEPTMFIPTPQTLPDDVTHQGDGEALLHVQVHNLYGQLMARATRAGLRQLQPERRAFVISRSGFAGLQRHALHWTGDNSSWWEHLWMSMPQLQNLGLSGYAWVGVDVGGFSGDATGELLARWTECGIFQPFCRNHSAKNTRRQEPWAFGEPYETHIRSMLRLRERLRPYLYTLFEEAHRSGAPILRPLLFDFPEDATTYAADDEFLVGSAILVAPIARPGTEYRHVYLPTGTWIHYWTDECHRGPAHILAHAPLGQPAVYVKANTPVPQLTDNDVLRWVVCVAADADGGSGEIYDDDGDGFAHEQGRFVRRRATCRASRSGVSVAFERLGGDDQWHYAREEFQFRCMERPTQVRLDGRPTSGWEHADRLLTLRLPRGVLSVEIDAAPTMNAV